MTGARIADEPTALFVADGELLVPTELARGPWSPDSLHGGPVAAAVARSVERSAAGGDGLVLVRLTLDLIRPVGTAPIQVSSRLVRPGRKVQLVDTIVTQAGQEVASSRSLRIRVDAALPEVIPSTPEDAPPDGPELSEELRSSHQAYRAFHTHGMQIRFVHGRFDRPGPAAAWFRLRFPVVAGESPSPVQRAVAAADFGNGIGAELDFATDVFINPDLTVSLHRPPVGEWVCVDTRTRFGSPGVGAAESALWDEEGRIGRSVQNLYVEPAR